ncbi:MAG: DinB family protein [Pirellulaceae bacterium]|nr:DinB family protein [Pirellulaceae bacterium]
METKEAIKSTMDLCAMVFQGYLEDLGDADLMKRPGEGCNHLAWQIGHLIASEVHMVESVCPGKGATLPDGFAEDHSKETAASDDASKFRTKDEYLSLMGQVREATAAALDELPDAKLDDPAPENFRSFCPTVGNMFILIGTHPMMHAGQIVPVRRQLGKPVVF